MESRPPCERGWGGLIGARMLNVMSQALTVGTYPPVFGRRAAFHGRPRLRQIPHGQLIGKSDRSPSESDISSEPVCSRKAATPGRGRRTADGWDFPPSP
jgi:hypothetical protein